MDLFKKQHGGLVPGEAVVEKLKLKDLNQGKLPSYSQIKESFSKKMDARDARFVLSEMLADQFSVGKEEQERINKKVSAELETRLTAIQEEAYQKAFEKGLTEGTEKAYSEKKNEIEAYLELLKNTNQTMEAAKKNLGKFYEQSLSDMAFKVAELIIRREIKVKPEIISSTLSTILENISKSEDVRIVLSKNEAEVIDKIRNDLQSLERDGRVQFEIDESFSDGNCVVISSKGEIAAFIEDELTKLKAAVDRQINSSLT